MSVKEIKEIILYIFFLKYVGPVLIFVLIGILILAIVIIIDIMYKCTKKIFKSFNKK